MYKIFDDRTFRTDKLGRYETMFNEYNIQIGVIRYCLILIFLSLCVIAILTFVKNSKNYLINNNYNYYLCKFAGSRYIDYIIYADLFIVTINIFIIALLIDSMYIDYLPPSLGSLLDVSTK